MFENNACPETRTIYIGGEISEKTSRETIQALHALARGKRSGDPVQIIINSEGGCTNEMLALFDAIKYAPFKTVGTVIGSCFSAASLLLQACDLRLLYPNATIMIHDGTASITRNHMREVAVTGVQLFKDMNIYYTLMSERSGLPARKIRNLCRFSTYFTSKEAVKAGLADGIITTEPPRRGSNKRTTK